MRWGFEAVEVDEPEVVDELCLESVVEMAESPSSMMEEDEAKSYMSARTWRWRCCFRCCSCCCSCCFFSSASSALLASTAGVVVVGLLDLELDVVDEALGKGSCSALLLPLLRLMLEAVVVTGAREGSEGCSTYDEGRLLLSVTTELGSLSGDAACAAKASSIFFFSS